MGVVMIVAALLGVLRDARLLLACMKSATLFL